MSKETKKTKLAEENEIDRWGIKREQKRKQEEMKKSEKVQGSVESI